MLNSNGDGIICDYCGNEPSCDFTYYSFDFKLVRVVNRFKKEYEQVLSADLCHECMKLFTDRLVDVSKVVKETEARCDVTGEVITSPDCVFYKCYVSKIDVALSTQPYKCVSCKKERRVEDGPCPDCSVNNLERIAAVTVDQDFVQLNFSKRIFELFESRLNNLKLIGANQWTQ